MTAAPDTVEHDFRKTPKRLYVQDTKGRVLVIEGREDGGLSLCSYDGRFLIDLQGSSHLILDRD
jgi:hypothetical protein